MTDYIQGIDVSKHQGRVDHPTVAASGMMFCICKATEGRDYEDPRFEENMLAIREVLRSGASYFPGAYHFARPDSGGGAEDGRAEAEDFCDVLERVCGDITRDFMPPALDFEKYSESDATDNIPWIEAFVDVVIERTGRVPMIYTGANIWRYEVGNTDLFSTLPLWQVFYSGTAKQPPKMPWDQWHLWQYSGGGSFQHHPKVPGAGVVDVNRWYGTKAELLEFAAASLEAPSPVVGPRPPGVVDLATLRGQGESPLVARVQGLLLAHGYGPQGLVSSSGLPDGVMGSKTEGLLKEFKGTHGLPRDTIVDWSTWWALTYDGISP